VDTPADGVNGPPSEEFKPTTAAEYRRMAVCTVRYGRATLTIRRWGGWSHLLGDSELSHVLNEYRDGRVTPDVVASAFVASRVKAHSPTYAWETADPDRLLKMVADCSTEPVFEIVDAEHVADQLLATQDEQRKSVSAAGAQLAKSAQSALGAVAQYANAIAGLGQAVSLRNAALTRAVATIKPLDSASLGRLVAVAPKFEPQPALGQWLSGALPMPAVAGLRLSSLDLGRLGAPDLSSALAGIRAASPGFAIPVVLQRSARKKEFGVGELLGAGCSAASLVGVLGDPQEAKSLASVVSDAREVIEAPELGTVAQAIDRLVKAIEDSDMQRRQDSDRHANDELIRWVFTMLLAIYVALWPYLFRP
jgi:hypothetical protein